MAIGGNNAGGEFNEVRMFMRPKGFKEGEDVRIEITKYQEGEGYKQGNGGTCGWITGNLEKVEKGSFQHNNKTYETLNVELVDDEAKNEENKPERYILGLLWGGAARELINRLAGLCEVILKGGEPIMEKVTIGVYALENEEHKIFKGVFLKYGDSSDIKQRRKVEKRWTHDQLKPRIKKVVINKQEQNDYTDLDEFFENVITKIIQPQILAPEPPAKEEKEETPSHEANDLLPPDRDTPPVDDMEPEDDLPF